MSPMAVTARSCSGDLVISCVLLAVLWMTSYLHTTDGRNLTLRFMLKQTHQCSAETGAKSDVYDCLVKSGTNFTVAVYSRLR